MTSAVDITTLARLVRRYDVSATLKSFAAVVAFLLVLTNLTTIFASVATIASFDREFFADAWVVVGVLVTAIVALVGPLGFVALDWMVRRPWQHLSALLAALHGAVAVVGPAVLLGLIAGLLAEEELLSLPVRVGAIAFLLLLLLMLLVWMTSPSAAWRRTVLAGFALLGVAATGLFAWSVMLGADDEPGGRWRAAGAVLGAVLLVALAYWWLIRSVAAQLVLAGDRPRELLVGALRGRSLWRRLAFLAGLPSSLWCRGAVRRPAFWAFLLARPLVYGGGWLLLRGANGSGIAVLTRHGATLHWLAAPATALALGAALVIGGHLLFYAGKRLATRDIWNPEAPPTGPAPVLFLRSFEDDQFHFPRPWWDLVGRWFDLWSYRRNADEALIDEIAQYGPVVALGMPGERRIPFGASRDYARHEDWQALVTRTAVRARAIVLAAGTSPGVRWEYALLAREGLLGKTLVLVPPGDDGAGTAPQEGASPEAGVSASFAAMAPGLPASLAVFQAVTGVHLPGAAPSRVPVATYAVPASEAGCAPGARAPAAGAGGAPERANAAHASEFMLLTAQRATASAWLVAMRGFFQRCGETAMRAG